MCVGGQLDQWLDCTHSSCLHSSQKPPQAPQRSSVRVFGEFSSPAGSRARLDSLSLRTEDQEAPPGSRSSHQVLISRSGYLKVWLCAGENNPHWVLGYLRAAQLVWAAARSWLTLCAENEAARLCLQLQAWRRHPRRDVRKEESGSLPVRTTPVWRRCEVSLGNREKSP